MSPAVILTSQRLRLRPLSADDADALHPLYADPVAMRWWSHPPHATIEETRAQLAERAAAADWCNWAITIEGDDRAIGTVASYELRQGRVHEIGYSLLPIHWCRGYATEAVSRLIDHLFDDRHARRIFADTDPDNSASNALLTRLGFVVEGRLRAHWQTHIGVRDSLIWGLLSADWGSRSLTEP